MEDNNKSNEELERLIEILEEYEPTDYKSGNATSNSSVSNNRNINQRSSIAGKAARSKQSINSNSSIKPNGYRAGRTNVGNSKPINIPSKNNYRKTSNLMLPRNNSNNESKNGNEESESRVSQTRRRAEDTTEKVVKIKKTITFLSKYKFLIIGCIIAFVIVMLFMFLMMAVELEGDDDSNSGDLSNPSSTYLANVYDECKSISVIGEDKLYDLEEYVAGVVTAENYIDMGIEALKAHAVVARTYAIVKTNNCQGSIDNSSKAQNFTSDIVDKARKAANETAGIVLTYDGEIFMSQYDSYCYEATACPDSSCEGDTCSVTYNKEPNNEKHTISIPSSWKGYFVSKYGHAQGMSQLVAYYMAEKGSTYEEILKFFYSPGIELSRLTNKSTGINSNVTLLPFSIRNTKPTRSDWAWSGEYSASNVGQCIWYAKGRMIEILNEAISDKEKRNSSINVINSTYGNACAWYNQSLLNTFGGSSNVNDYRIGSLIVWKYAGSECNYNNNFGHVAIIENITEDGKVIVSEGYAAGGNSCPDTWDCVRTLARTFNTVEEFTNWVNNYKNAGGTQYDFLGYIHILG